MKHWGQQSNRIKLLRPQLWIRSGRIVQTRERKGTWNREGEHKAPCLVWSTLPPLQPNASIGDIADAAWVKELPGGTVALGARTVVKLAAIRHFQKAQPVTEGEKKTSNEWSHQTLLAAWLYPWYIWKGTAANAGWPHGILSPLLNTNTDFLTWMTA